MSDVATDVYPLTVEEYESAEVISDDGVHIDEVEVEQFQGWGFGPTQLFINKTEYAYET